MLNQRSFIFSLVSICFITSSLGFALLAGYFGANSYTTVLQLLIDFFDLASKATVIEKQYFTEHRYDLLTYSFIGVSLVFLVLSVFLHKKKERFLSIQSAISQEVKEWFVNQYRLWESFNQQEKNTFWIFFCSLTMSRLALAWTYPFHIDEAFSYVFLVSKGAFITISFYPGPNNHIAFLLLCAGLDKVMSNPLWVMRLPSLFFSTLTIPLLYISLRRYVSFGVVLFTLAFFCFSPYGLFYAVHGRGYAMQIFIMLCTWLSGIQVINRKSIAAEICFVISSVLGFYTIPSFIYFFSSLLLWSLTARLFWPNIKRVMWLLVIIGTGVMLLYSPIFLLSGWKSIIANTWVKPQEITAFLAAYPSYLWELHGNLLSWESGGGVLVLLVWGACSWVFFYPTIAKKLLNTIVDNSLTEKKIQQMAMGFLSLSLFPLVLLPFQRVLPFHRVFLYKSLAEFFVLAVIAVWIVQQLKLKKKWLIGFLMTFFYISFSLFTAYTYISDKHSIYRQMPKLIRKVVSSNVKHIFVGEDVYNVFLRLEYLKIGQQLDIEVDKADKNDEVLILRKAQLFPLSLDSSAYTKFYEDDFVSGYRQNFIAIEK